MGGELNFIFIGHLPRKNALLKADFKNTNMTTIKNIRITSQSGRRHSLLLPYNIAKINSIFQFRKLFLFHLLQKFFSLASKQQIKRLKGDFYFQKTAYILKGIFSIFLQKAFLIFSILTARRDWSRRIWRIFALRDFGEPMFLIKFVGIIYCGVRCKGYLIAKSFRKDI